MPKRTGKPSAAGSRETAARTSEAPKGALKVRVLFQTGGSVDIVEATVTPGHVAWGARRGSHFLDCVSEERRKMIARCCGSLAVQQAALPEGCFVTSVSGPGFCVLAGGQAGTPTYAKLEIAEARAAWFAFSVKEPDTAPESADLSEFNGHEPEFDHDGAA